MIPLVAIAAVGLSAPVAETATVRLTTWTDVGRWLVLAVALLILI